MSLRRHILQVVALVTAVALVFGAFAGSAGAKKASKGKKAQIRAELRKQVKKNPAVVKRRAFLRKAALVNFKLPITIRIRNTCNVAENPTGGTLGGVAPQPQALTPAAAGGVNCATQGTALNQRTVPSANVNLGPSLGTRSVALGGTLSAVVEFNDTYDGGALGNVNVRILPDNRKGVRTSSVPLLWNNDITGSHVVGGTRTDKNNALANLTPGAPLWSSIFGAAGGGPTGTAVANGANTWASTLNQGCGDWTGTAAGIPNQSNTLDGIIGTPPGQGYKPLFYGLSSIPSPPLPGLLNLGIGAGNGVPGYTLFNSGSGIGTNGGILPVFPGTDNPANIRAGAVIGDNEWVGLNPNPFPSGFAPGTTLGGAPGSYGNARDTVLRTNALTLDIAAGGTSVNMSTGTTPVGTATTGGLTTAQGSQDITMGYSGGQANLFGNIPGKNVGIDVTVNLATKINAIARIMDQDVFKAPTLIEGENYPAGIFNCRQIMTGAVQNYIPGVRLTGSLRIAPAITKDGKIRIAKATVQSDLNNPTRVALSACLFPAKPGQNYTTTGSGLSTDALAAKLPSRAQIDGGGAPGVAYLPLSGVTSYALEGNTALPHVDTKRWSFANTIEGRTGPDDTRCGTDAPSIGNGPGLADIIRQSGLTGTVSGLPVPGTTQYEGILHRGDQATVGGDITVNPVEVDVLLGDQPHVN